jgi:hypothetical protein
MPNRHEGTRPAVQHLPGLISPLHVGSVCPHQTIFLATTSVYRAYGMQNVSCTLRVRCQRAIVPNRPPHIDP